MPNSMMMPGMRGMPDMQDMRGMPGMRTESGDETPEVITSTPDERKVLFPQLITANIRFDFVEFKNPVEEN